MTNECAENGGGGGGRGTDRVRENQRWGGGWGEKCKRESE